MYFWNSYPFIRLSIVLIAGIFSFDFTQSLWDYWLNIIVILILLFSISLLVSSFVGHYQFRIVNGIIALSIIFLIAGELVKRKYHDYPKDHYGNVVEPLGGFSGTITSPASERTNYFRYEFELRSAVRNDSIFPISGIIHLYVRKDSTYEKNFKYGDQLIVSGKLFPVSPPGNPHEFNFQQYLSYQKIYAHAFVKRTEIKKAGNKPPNRIFQYAYNIQGEASKIIDEHISQPRENGIAKALLLGIKDHLDNEIKKSYSAAGAMHVLAVSGLHVGIVFMFIHFLLGKMKKTQLGRILFGLIAIIFIWIYAVITGLSPSVLRAATMFSIVALGEINSVKGNIYNSLGLAAFILLLFDPYLIYSVGFQLSFSAVFGIVYLQKKIYRLVEFNHWLFDKAWAITCVSIAAQMATFPLTAFYFHQFPTYFLVSNLVVIPAATLMLVGGLLMLLIDPIVYSLSDFIGYLLSKLIWIVNESVSLVQSLPNSLIEWIYLDLTGLVLTYCIVIFLIWGLHHKSFKTLLIGVTVFFGFLTAKFFGHYHQSQEERIVIYEVKHQLAIDHIKGHKSTLFVDAVEDLELLAFQINPNRMALGLDPISKSIQSINQSNQFTIEPPFTYGIIDDIKMLFIDSTTFNFDFNKQIATDILIIENGSVKSLEWLQQNFQFKHLIIGNKNSRFFNEKMKEQAMDQNVRIHSLIDEGAFILDVRN